MVAHVILGKALSLKIDFLFGFDSLGFEVGLGLVNNGSSLNTKPNLNRLNFECRYKSYKIKVNVNIYEFMIEIKFSECKIYISA